MRPPLSLEATEAFVAVQETFGVGTVFPNTLLLVPPWGCTSGPGRSEMVGVVERGPTSIPCSRVSKMELAGATSLSRCGSRRVLSGDSASCVESSVAHVL